MNLAESVAARAANRRARFKPITRTQQKRRAFYLFIAPWLLGFILLSIVPFIVGFLISFTNYDGLNLDRIDFVGLRNYARAVEDPNLQHGFQQTLFWAALNLPLWLIVSFALALLVNQKLKGMSLFRTLLYLPGLIPGIALIYTWKIMLEQNYGLVNAAISLVRPGTVIPWLSTYSLFALTGIAAWGGMGFGMLVFLAGLQDIPEEVIEAARIDGANNLQLLFRVILPLMSPIIFFQLILGLIGSLQQVALPLLMATSVSSSGSPARPVYLYMVHVFRTLIGSGRFGLGMAMLWLNVLLIIVLTFIVFKLQRRWVYTEVEGQ